MERSNARVILPAAVGTSIELKQVPPLTFFTGTTSTCTGLFFKGFKPTVLYHFGANRIDSWETVEPSEWIENYEQVDVDIKVVKRG